MQIRKFIAFILVIILEGSPFVFLALIWDHINYISMSFFFIWLFLINPIVVFVKKWGMV